MLKELIEFPELHENQQFKYSSKEIDWTEVDGLSEESLSDSQSENSSLASEKVFYVLRCYLIKMHIPYASALLFRVVFNKVWHITTLL